MERFHLPLHPRKSCLSRKPQMECSSIVTRSPASSLNLKEKTVRIDTHITNVAPSARIMSAHETAQREYRKVQYSGSFESAMNHTRSSVRSDSETYSYRRDNRKVRRLYLDRLIPPNHTTTTILDLGIFITHRNQLYLSPALSHFAVPS
jgi:hypothetical protein